MAEENVAVSGRMLTKPLVLVTLISAFGSSVQYGYNAFLVTYPAEHIQSFFNATYRFRNVISIDRNVLWFQWGLTVSFFPLGGLCGTLMVGPVVDSIGRKKTLLANNLLALIAAALVVSSKPMRSHEILICSRLFVGICAGVAFSVVPMYLAEIAPQNLRGALCTVADLFITFGSLMAEVIGFHEVLGSEEGWPVLLSLTGLPALVQLLLLPFFPESPRYLLIQRKQEEEARKAFKKLRGLEDVEREMEELRQEGLLEKVEKDMDVLKILHYPTLRWHLVSVIILMGGQQLSGINAAQHYAKQIYLSSGVSRMTIWYISLALSLFLMVITTLVISIVESSGRRILLLTGFSICSISCIFLTMSLELQKNIPALSYLSASFLTIFLIGYATGPGPVPSVLVAEFFLQSSRSTAFVIAGGTHWLCKLLITVTYLHVEADLEPYSFLLFWPFSIATVFYVFKIIPETKDRSFLETRKLMSLHQGQQS
ncbi:solute carrier family 2, facilitated glucose transporter member 5-like [Python bivittatus]|uniref:Solute carrier family 2, facilitated glucose transporter member 5 n=1 Tax=Python bivittatus TaxID=176946 RepID=A0A9F5MSZ9_PYTBI|nr:solute carrier family 2, facilitated glucose transporter member 5-like [Python bivittatus]